MTVPGLNNLHTIQNHKSGDPLPTILLTVLDELRQPTTAAYSGTMLEATISSPDGFTTGPQTLVISDPQTTIEGLTVFVQPGRYHLVINFNQESLMAITIQVNVRDCFMGESREADGYFCQKCNALSYSFNSTNSSGCIPCPENAYCETNAVRPDKGYWTPFPCSEHLQRCLTKMSCDYDGRDKKLDGFGTDLASCTFNDTTIAEYTTTLCRQGHKGPLCGSCEADHGKSQSFNCRPCFSQINNTILMILSIVMLIGLAGFTIRSSLATFTSLMHMREANVGQTTNTQPLPHAERVEVEMMEHWIRGEMPLTPMDSTTAASSDRLERTVVEVELAKWQSVELFKITVSFLQITAIAIAINVEWSLLLIGLFEAAEFAGGVTAEATNRSVDCLVPEDSSIPRSIVSVIIDLIVPIGVISLFIVVWAFISRAKKQSLVYTFKRSVLSALAVLYISYISISRALVNILNCIDVHDSLIVMVDHTSKYWAVDTSLKCYEGSHAVLAGIVGWPLLFLFTLLFPVTTAILIIKNVKEDYKEGWIYDVAGFLYRSYRPRYVFWESVIMLRKAVLAVIVVFAYPLGGNLQAVLAVFVLVLASYMQMVCRPYRKEFDSLNEMEGVSLIVSTITFVSSLCFDNDRVSLAARIVITVVIFVCNVGLLLFFCAMFFVYSSKYLRAVLVREGVPFSPDRGTLHILRVYFGGHISNVILKGFRSCFRCLIGPRFYDKRESHERTSHAFETQM